MAGADGSFTDGDWNNLDLATWTPKIYNFTTTENTTATLKAWEWNNGSSISIDYVQLLETENAIITPYINFEKAFGKGTADIDIAYVNYDLTGAYASYDLGTSIENKHSNPTKLFYTNENMIVSTANSLVSIKLKYYKTNI